MSTNRRHPDRGASVLVLLVGLVVVGLVATVVVIGLRRHPPTPTVAQCDDDRAALQRAEDEMHTKHSHYGTQADLIAAGLLESRSSLHDVSLGPDSYTIIGRGTCAATSSTEAAVAATMHLAFGSVPATVTAGRVIDPAITVTLTDESGAVVPDSTTEITISLQPLNAARLSGTTTVLAQHGVATFTDLAIDKAGGGYSFIAAAQGAASQSSSQLAVVPGSIAKLHFISAPATATPGTVFAAQPVVQVEDVMGNVIADAADPIDLTIAPHSGAKGAQLKCDATSIVPVAGVAQFSGCAIDRSGVDYMLTATMGRLTGSTDRFAVIGAPSQLVIIQQPTQVVAGDAVTVVVAVEDSAGNVITDSTATVNVAINKNSSSLSGTTSMTVVDGVATFKDPAIATAGAGYTLTMKADGLRSATTSPFDVLTASPTQLVFSRQPSGGRAGKSWPTQPIVAFADPFGNEVPMTDEITLQLTPGTGTPNAVIVCTANPLAAVNGEARFFKCNIDQPGTDYTLTATSGALVGVSAPFSIT